MRTGWVFRVEVVTKDVAMTTEAMKAKVISALMGSPDISKILVEELFESIKIFQKKKKD